MNYNISVYGREGKLYIKYYQFGRRQRKSLGLPDNDQSRKHVDKVIKPLLTVKLVNNEPFELVEKSLAFYLDLVLEKTKANRKQGTYDVYCSLMPIVKEAFTIPMHSIRASDVETFSLRLQKEGRSGSSIGSILSVLSSAFRLAIKDGYVSSNPVLSAEKPKIEAKRKFSYTQENVRTLLNASKGTMKIFLYIGFFTGMRAGEIVALKWSDIDFENNKINVNKTMYRKNEDLPKGNKIRIIPMFLELKEYLLSVRPEFGGYVLSKGTLEPFSGIQSFNIKFQRLLSSLGFAKTSLHITRHTFTSLMLQSKVNPVLIKEFLGHYDQSLIFKTYGHLLQDSEIISCPFGFK